MGEPKRMNITSDTVTAEATEGHLPGGNHPFLSATFRSFSYHDFRLLWFGAFTSTIGTWMQLVAEAWVVLDLTGSAFYLGLTRFLGQLPIILFTLIGGVIADRIDRRKLLLVSQFVQMSTALILTVLIYFDWIQIWHFLVLVFVVGTAQAFGGPAYHSLIPTLVKRKDVPNAIALNSIQFNLARVIGPLLAAAALALVGPALCFGLNGISFLSVIICLFLIQTTFKPQQTDESIVEGLKQGLTYVKNQRKLWQLSVLGFIVTFCGMPLMVLLPIYARDIFQTGSTGYSIMMTFSGAGAVLGALLYARLKDIKARGRLTLQVQLALSLLIATFALSRNLLLSYVILFLSGLCLMILFTSITSLVQLSLTEEMRGRVTSIFMLAFRGGMPLGSLSAGALASRFSPSTALITMSALLGLSAVGFLVFQGQVKRI